MTKNNQIEIDAANPTPTHIFHIKTIAITEFQTAVRMPINVIKS